MTLLKTVQKNLTQNSTWANIMVYLVLPAFLIPIYIQVIGFDSITFDDNGYIYGNPRVLNGLTLDNLFHLSYFSWIYGRLKD